MNSFKRLFLSRGAFFCIVAFVACVSFYSAKATAQTKDWNQTAHYAAAAPVVSATLTDSFPDPDQDGRAKPGDEITYTATIVNNGTSDATNVRFTNQINSNTTLVPNSLQVQPDNRNVLRCTFSTAAGGSGSCGLLSSAFASTDSNNFTILGGQSTQLNLAATNVGYNSGTQKFSFNATIQNLLAQSLGTIDSVTLESTGIRLFLNEATVTSGTGSISFANADGTAQFTAANQPYFQYNTILAQNQTSAAKTLQLNVPNTVNTFTLDFLISTKVAVKLVINEVLANPGGGLMDPNGEWFEIYNAGLFPVNLKNFTINDYSTTSTPDCEPPPGNGSLCPRPDHIISSDLIIPSGGYTTFGNSADTATNGGVPIDYAYGTALSLANSTDGVRIQSPNNVTLDQAAYASPALSAQDGVSRELKNPAYDNSLIDGSNWASALATAVYGSGGRGTPKAQNSTFTAARAETEFTSFEFDFQSIFSQTRNDGLTGNYQAKPQAGETVSVNVGTISAGGSATVTYKVTIANPLPAGTTQISTQGFVTGDNFPAVPTDDPDVNGASDPTVTLIFLAPTAATVAVSGHVTNPLGRGITGVRLSLTDSQGNTRSTVSSADGYYEFADVQVGETYIISATGKHFTFSQPVQVLNVNEETTEVNFIADSEKRVRVF